MWLFGYISADQIIILIIQTVNDNHHHEWVTFRTLSNRCNNTLQERAKAGNTQAKLTHLFDISYFSALSISIFVLPFQSFISRRTFHKKRKQVALVWFPQTFSVFNVWSPFTSCLWRLPLVRCHCLVVLIANRESCDSQITSRVIHQLRVVWFPNYESCISQITICVNPKTWFVWIVRVANVRMSPLRDVPMEEEVSCSFFSSLN